MHHLFSIFKEGHRVLDIGTGSGGWAQLAIKYNKSTEKDPLVICVDKLELTKLKGAKMVKGNFVNKETKVSIV
jgi:23S rRNA U2552 (ribose-2'-O)-methylase RlmE/FtsJ